MPSKSVAQEKMMQIAEHAPEKLYARNKGVLSMTHSQIHDFASGSEKDKPQYAPKRKLKFPSPLKEKK